MGLTSLAPLTIGAHRIERPIVLAPMAGVSERPYRLLALELGAGLAPTELISARGLELGSDRTEAYLRHEAAREQPFTVQIFGGEPRSMARAAELAVERGARIIDINMGCPVRKVTRSGAGSALMTDPDRAVAIVEAIRERVGDGVPITAKIRAGWDRAHRNAPAFGRRLADAGVALLSIHGRTREDGYTGDADWDVIAALVRAVSVPVIANGDIFGVADADRVLEQTGCAGVMIGRAALGNPWIFRALAAAADGAEAARPTPSERARLVRRHFDAHLEHHGAPSRAVPKFRQHLIWYSRGLIGGVDFRDRAVGLIEVEAVRDAIDDYFGRADLEDADEPPIYDARAALG
jgi:tRNA-dihydrouridine synthase B